MICSTCKEATDSTVNGDCPKCWAIAHEKWRAKMAIRIDPTQFDLERLVNMILLQHWMHECKIIQDYMPPFPRPDTRPKCVIKYIYENGVEVFLRHSKGPLQGYDWDCYGDDFHRPELAIFAISKAPPPPHVGVCIPTHGH